MGSSNKTDTFLGIFLWLGVCRKNDACNYIIKVYKTTLRRKKTAPISSSIDLFDHHNLKKDTKRSDHKGEIVKEM